MTDPQQIISSQNDGSAIFSEHCIATISVYEDYKDGNLSLSEINQLEEHLSACPDCLKTIAENEKFAAFARFTLDEEPQDKVLALPTEKDKVDRQARLFANLKAELGI